MKNRVTVTTGVLLALMFSGCAQVPSAQRANYEGNDAYYKQRYDDALDKYQRSLTLANEKGDKQYAAIAMFGLARTYAQLCLDSEADRWFKQSIVAREKVVDIEYAHLTQNLLEHGRFLVSSKRNAEAVAQYDRAMSMLEKSDIAKLDPMGYALVFDEYEALLRSVGRSPDADAAAGRARSLREANNGRQAQFRPEPYPACSRKTGS